MKKNLLIFWGIVLVILLAVEILMIHPEHAHEAWQKIKGFHLFLGLAGGIVLMGIAKALGIFWLYRKDDYYD